jgi:hypothetical protein
MPRLMKRRLAPALIAIILAGTLAVQAQAQPHGSALGVASGKAAIDRFASRLTYQITSARPSAATSWQVSACRVHGEGAVCTGEWTFTGERCSVRMQALRAGASLHVSELGKLACSREDGTQSGASPAP